MRASTPGADGRQPLQWALAAALLAAIVGMPAVGAGPAWAADPTACGLTVLSSSNSGGAGSDILVAVPRALSQIDLPAAAFQVFRGGKPVPVWVQRKTGSQPSVVVVIASSVKTTKAAFDRAREGALELLVGLPDGTRTAAVSTGQQAPFASLSDTRARSTMSLEHTNPGAGVDTSGAIRRAARELPPGGHVVLFTDSTPDGFGGSIRAAVRELRTRSVLLDRVAYGTATVSDPAEFASLPGCLPSAAAVLPQVDAVLATIRGQYRLHVPTAPAAATRLSVQFAGVTASAVIAASPRAGMHRAIANPYAETRFPPALSAGLYTAAGLFGLIGLLLVTRRRPWGGGTSMSPP